MALALLTLHPGHGYAPLCEPPDPRALMCLPPPAQEDHGGSILLARSLLTRGGTRFAALQVAVDAQASAEAAAVLADALDALGDPYGATLVRERAGLNPAPPPAQRDPAATGASAPGASPGTK